MIVVRLILCGDDGSIIVKVKNVDQLFHDLVSWGILIAREISRFLDTEIGYSILGYINMLCP